MYIIFIIGGCVYFTGDLLMLGKNKEKRKRLSLLFKGIGLGTCLASFLTLCF